MADVITNIGNEKANAYWEFNLPEGRKPGPNDTTYALESFIKDKYVNKRFIKKGAEPPSGKANKKSKTKKDKEPEPKKEESEDEEVSSEEEVEKPKPKAKTKKTHETKATKKPSPKTTKEVPEEPKPKPKETKPKETKPKETKPKEIEPTKEDDILTFNNWQETMPTGTDDFGSFFSPEPTPAPTPTPTPTPAPTPAAPAKPAPDIMSLFKTPQPSFQNPYPQVGAQMGYGYPYPQPYMQTNYVPPHIAAGGPMASAATPRRKVNNTNDVMALF
jgi:hypothetical protein